MSNRRSPARSRALRRSSTEAESRLWFRLRNRQVGGYKFRRQEAIGPYVVDFFCHDALLVIEVDGAQHLEGENARNDEKRTGYFRFLGLRILRFDNRQVLAETDAVVETIFGVLRDDPSP